MIVVHHLNHSRSQRVLWLLEELGLAYELKRYEREKSGLAPKSLEAVHPLCKSPVITDGALTLAASPRFAGPEFSAADIQMSFPIEAAAARAGLDRSGPRLMDYLARIHARPAYQRALVRGGPFELMS